MSCCCEVGLNPQTMRPGQVIKFTETLQKIRLKTHSCHINLKFDKNFTYFRVIYTFSVETFPIFCGAILSGDGSKNGCERITCDHNPCYPGVECFPTSRGFRCASCPEGYVGDGTRSGCRRISKCSRKSTKNFYYSTVEIRLLKCYMAVSILCGINS